MTRDAPGLLLVTDRHQLREGRTLAQTVRDCVDGGVRHVLVRERDLADEDYDRLLDEVLEAAGDEAVVLTRTPVSRPGVGGYHQSSRERAASDSRCLTGRSAHCAADLRDARDAGIHYVTVGPFALTTSKPGYGPPLGVGGIVALRGVVTDSPAVLAIGGVTPADIPPLAAAGIGAAVMGPLMRSADPAALAAEYHTATSTVASH